MSPVENHQQILVPYDFSRAGDHALQCAVELARIFGCGISIIHVITKKIAGLYSGEGEADKILRNKLIATASQLISGSGVATEVYVFRGKTEEVVARIYEKLNVICMVAGINEKKSPYYYFTPTAVVTDYRNLRVPLIVVHDELPRQQFFGNIVLPVDFNRESKEKAVWGGYIGKMNKSKVTLVVREYRDEYFAASLRNNLALITKLYANLEVDYDVVKDKNIHVAVDKYALEYAWLNRGDLLVIMATAEVAIDHLVMGLPEKKIIDNKYKLPVMLINPRDDLYIPCGC